MHFELVQELHAPLEAVEATFVDPQFVDELGRLPKLGHPRLLEQEDRGHQVWQRIRYAFTGDLSAAVRAVIDPARLTWVEESTLDRRSHRTIFTIQPDNYANLLEACGAIQLAAGRNEAATTRTAAGTVSVHMPLVGRKVETAIISGLREHAELEVGLVDSWATAHH